MDRVKRWCKFAFVFHGAAVVALSVLVGALLFVVGSQYGPMLEGQRMNPACRLAVYLFNDDLTGWCVWLAASVILSPCLAFVGCTLVRKHDASLAVPITVALLSSLWIVIFLGLAYLAADLAVPWFRFSHTNCLVP